MPACIVKGCTNRSSAKSHRQEELEKTMKITFHAFPKCPMKRQLWFNSLGLENSVVPKRPIICSVHFKHEDMDRTSLVYVRLRENAIPLLKNTVYLHLYKIQVKFPEIIKEEDINVLKEISTEVPSTSEIVKGENIDVREEISIEEPWISEIIKEENIDVYEEIATEEPSTSVCLDSYNTSSTIIIAETGNSVGFTKLMSQVSEKVLKIESDSNNEHMGALLQTSDKSTEAKVSSVDKSTCISPSMLFDSPGKQMLREHISQLKRKHALELAALKAKMKRRDIKIMNLQTTLQTLKNKNLLEEEEVHFLSGISEFNSSV